MLKKKTKMIVKLSKDTHMPMIHILEVQKGLLLLTSVVHSAVFF